MSHLRSGGPAFPRPAHASLTYEDLGSAGADPQEGMSLREWYAGLVLQGVIAGRVPGSGFTKQMPVDVARLAFEFADAMVFHTEGIVVVDVRRSEETAQLRAIVTDLAAIPFGEALDHANLTTLVARAREAVKGGAQ